MGRAWGKHESGSFLSSPPQGSFLIYPESEATSTEPKISRGIPQNRPLKLLVRVYVVKVSRLPTTSKILDMRAPRQKALEEA